EGHLLVAAPEGDAGDDHEGEQGHGGEQPPARPGVDQLAELDVDQPGHGDARSCGGGAWPDDGRVQDWGAHAATPFGKEVRREGASSRWSGAVSSRNMSSRP